MRKKALNILVLHAFLAGFIVWSIPTFAGNTVIFGEPELLPDFKLLDHNDKAFTKLNFKNQWSLMFFGYTSCPDVCPATLGILDTASSMINSKTGKNELPVKVIMVSLDPIRDTPEKLKEYIKYFNKDFIAVTGNKRSEVVLLTYPLGVDFDFEDAKTNLPIEDYDKLTKEDDYLVNHFGGIFIVDPMERVTAIVLPPHDPDKLASLFQYIRKTSSNDQEASK
jgi:protein SCO1/2